MAPKLPLRLLRGYASFALNLFFKRLQIHNVKAIPEKGPVIFVPNHQNAFLDAIIVICKSPRHPWSIARASVFKEGLATKILLGIRIKPVFRVRDGWSTLRNNDAILREWAEMLAQEEDIQIFAEGNHNDPYAGGTLQKGFARMAILFKEKYPDVPLTIVPVGLHYDDHYTFRSRVLLNFGEAISVDKILEQSPTDREKLDGIVDATHAGMKRLAIAINPDETYKAKVDFLRQHRVYKKDMLEQLEADRKVLAAYPNLPPVSVKKSSVFWKVINPIVWLGVLTNIIPYRLMNGFLKAKIKDPQWILSIKFAFGLFVLPFYYLIAMVVFYLVVPNVIAAIGVGILMPLTGILATDFLKK